MLLYTSHIYKKLIETLHNITKYFKITDLMMKFIVKNRLLIGLTLILFLYIIQGCQENIYYYNFNGYFTGDSLVYLTGANGSPFQQSYFTCYGQKIN